MYRRHLQAYCIRRAFLAMASFDFNLNMIPTKHKIKSSHCIGTSDHLSCIIKACRILQAVLGGVVHGRRGSRALGGDIRLGHTTIHHKVMAVDKAAVIAGQEQNRLRLLNGLPESASREVHLSPVSFGLVIAQPILQQRGVQRRRAQAVESIPLPGMHNRQLPRHGQHSTLASGVSQLRCSRPDKRNNRRSVDDRPLGLVVSPQRKDGVLATKPDALDVDVLRQIPDVLGGVDRVVVAGVHDASIVEHDVDAAPGVEGLDGGLDGRLLGDVADGGFDLAGGGDELFDFCLGAGEDFFGYVGHEDVGAFAGEEDGCFEADATRRR